MKQRVKIEIPETVFSPPLEVCLINYGDGWCLEISNLPVDLLEASDIEAIHKKLVELENKT